MDSIIKLALELKRVADLNHDKFLLRIVVEAGTTAAKSVRYEIICEEAADRHNFLAVRDADLNQAAIRAFASIPDACKNWGYQYREGEKERYIAEHAPAPAEEKK